ncbi:MAG: hypothetical protein HZC02_04720 [Candidatus Levybacteria bacterium]|nr:hypothetical protein [Candidatus Levybacteria bacterium]
MKKLFTKPTLSYLRFFAKKALDKHQPTIIGIAGSVGKSSTRNAIEAVLKDHFPTKSVGNSETGIPLGILGMKPENYSKIDWIKMVVRSPFNIDFLEDTKYLIAEMGIDEPDAPKNMTYLLTILKPDIAISLNVSATHSLQFDKTVKKEGLSEEERLKTVIGNIAKEDTKIITASGCKVGIYNADDAVISPYIEKVQESQKLLTFGTKSMYDISYGKYDVSRKGTSFTFFIKHDDKHQELSLTFNHHIFPQEYREVFSAAILVGLQADLSPKQIKESIEKNYETPKGRSSIFEGINSSIIIDATYNASKASIVTFLDLVDTLKKETDHQVVFLMGDMRELGQESQIEHEEVAKKIIGIVDYLYLVGPLTRQYFMKDNLTNDSIVLAKGSQNTIFLEEAVKVILKNKEDQKKLCRQDDFWMKIKSGS